MYFALGQVRLDDGDVPTFPTSPDFTPEPTREFPLCWKCGPETFMDDGTPVRKPRMALFCECAPMELTIEDMEEVR